MGAVEQVGRAHGVGGGGLHGQVRLWAAGSPYLEQLRGAQKRCRERVRRRLFLTPGSRSVSRGGSRQGKSDTAVTVVPRFY